MGGEDHMKATKAIIFSHENGGSYVMDHDGCFSFVRGHSAEPIGTEIDVSQQAPVSVMRIMSAAACFILVAFVSIFAWLWNVTDYYVYVDINPSVEMRFNGLGRLKNAAALNSDGTRLLSDLSLKGTADEAVVSLIEAARQKNFLNDVSSGPNVLVTVIAARGKSPDNLIASINTALRERGMQEYTVVKVGNLAFRDKAEGLGVSPGRLQLAEELLRGAGADMTLEEILRIPLGELLGAIDNPEGPGGAAIIEGRIADDGVTGPQSPAGTDNGNNDNNPGGSQTAGNGEGDDPTDDDPTADDTIIITTPATPGASAPYPPAGGSGISTPTVPGASASNPPSADPPPTNPPATADPPPTDDPPSTDPPATDPPPTDPPPTDPPPSSPRRNDPRDTDPPGDNGGNGPTDEPPGDGDPTDEPPGDDDPTDEPPGGDDDPTEPKDPHEGDPHPDDCGCEICVGESNKGFGAEVYALVTGSGNQRKVAITLIDMYGSYSQVFDYVNGTADSSYEIEGTHFTYKVFVIFSGNAVEAVFITGFETKEGDVFGATVTASVEGTGSSRNVVITVTDEDGDHEKTFVYVNGMKSEVYMVEGITRIYKVYILYKGNEVDIALIFDYEDEADEDG